MNTDLHRSKTSKDGSVLQIGTQYFWFDSPAAAAQAFELLSKAVHVRHGYRAIRSGAAHRDEYEPQELIGDLSVKIVPRTELKISDRKS